MIAMSLRAALYGRFSSDRQNRSSSIDQLRQCEERASLNGWTIKHRFNDDAVSGKEDKRPGYVALQEAVSRGEVDVVLAESLSRLSRNQAEIARFFDDCQYREVQIFTLSEGHITRMHIGMLGTMNAIFLDNLAEATYRGVESKVLAGKTGGGRAYGYRVPTDANGQRRKGDLEIVAEEAAVIRRIFADYAKGLSPRAIAEALNLEGIPAPRLKSKGKNMGDGTWRANTIHGNRQRGIGIINNDLYAGRRIWNRLRFVHKPGEKKRLSRLNPESEWRIDEMPHLRIVPEDLWQAARQRQGSLDALREAKDTGDARHLSGSHATKRPSYLLSGLIHCGCCGGTMNIGGSKPKRYYCANAREKGVAVCPGIPGIPQHTLEGTVLDGLKAHMMQPQAVAEFITRYQAHQRELDAERRDKVSRIRTALATTASEIANIITAIKSGFRTASMLEELEALEAWLIPLSQVVRIRPRRLVRRRPDACRWRSFVGEDFAVLASPPCVGLAGR